MVRRLVIVRCGANLTQVRQREPIAKPPRSFNLLRILSTTAATASRTLRRTNKLLLHGILPTAPTMALYRQTIAPYHCTYYSLTQEYYMCQLYGKLTRRPKEKGVFH